MQGINEACVSGKEDVTKQKRVEVRLWGLVALAGISPWSDPTSCSRIWTVSHSWPLLGGGGSSSCSKGSFLEKREGGCGVRAAASPSS